MSHPVGRTIDSLPSRSGRKSNVSPALNALLLPAAPPCPPLASYASSTPSVLVQSAATTIQAAERGRSVRTWAAPLPATSSSCWAALRACLPAGATARLVHWASDQWRRQQSQKVRRPSCRNAKKRRKSRQPFWRCGFPPPATPRTHLPRPREALPRGSRRHTSPWPRSSALVALVPQETPDRAGDAARKNRQQLSRCAFSLPAMRRTRLA